MQNSELFRRGIVSPLDERAELEIRSNVVDETTQVAHLAIQGEALFDYLWSSGLFREINRRCGSIIDDYEEEIIDACELPNLLAAVKWVAECEDSPEAMRFLEQLSMLASSALALNRPVLFVL